MEEKKNPLKPIKFEVRHAPMSLKIILALLIIFSMAALTALRWIHLEFQAETGSILDEAAALEHENQELTDKIADLGSVQSIEDIAKEELGLVNPDTVIITPEKP